MPKGSPQDSSGAPSAIGANRETVADQNRRIERKLRSVPHDRQPGWQAARGDGDIVAALRQTRDRIKGQWTIRVQWGLFGRRPPLVRFIDVEPVGGQSCWVRLDIG